MTRYAAGAFDRRIQIQECRDDKDAANDVIQIWADEFKLWTQRRPGKPGEEIQTAGGTIRQFELIFRVRDSALSRRVAPETHRVVYRGKIYEIISVLPGVDRDDVIDVFVSARPDQRGPRGDDAVTHAP